MLKMIKRRCKRVLNLSLVPYLFCFYSLQLILARVARYVFRQKKEQLLVAVLIDEYFGEWDTPYGGYGFLARHIVAAYLPNQQIEVEVILHGLKVQGGIQCRKIDGKNVYKLSEHDFLSKIWLEMKDYDIYLSIELTHLDAIVLAPRNHKHILWFQDPRPLSVWQFIETMKLMPEYSFWSPTVYEYVREHSKQIRFISQGVSLKPLGRELYQLSELVNVGDLPNPITIDFDYDLQKQTKKNQIIFLARLESQKRPWVFCEIAKQMPMYEFYVLGQAYRRKEEMEALLLLYSDVKNLHFVGHLGGNDKRQFLVESKILLNTSIWEGIPISWLEALSYGTLIVSCLDVENLASSFGKYIGNVPGDGLDLEAIELFKSAINFVIENEEWRKQKAQDAIKYARSKHSIQQFQMDMRDLILETSEKR
jgi:glycosyltransferase involved in cell wall biosynthesis